MGTNYEWVASTTLLVSTRWRAPWALRVAAHTRAVMDLKADTRREISGTVTGYSLMSHVHIAAYKWRYITRVGTL